VDDTSPRVRALLVEGYRRMSPAKKLQRVAELNAAVLELAAAGIRRRHGAVAEEELRLRLAALWLDRETMMRAFGWDPRKHGT